jgi:hypothetical protein
MAPGDALFLEQPQPCRLEYVRGVGLARAVGAGHGPDDSAELPNQADSQKTPPILRAGSKRDTAAVGARAPDRVPR